MKGFFFFAVMLVIYSGQIGFHIFKLMTVKASYYNHKKRFSKNSSILILLFSAISASLIGFPFESQTLQFMNENGLVNIYIILLSYLFAPNHDPNEIKLTEEDL